MSVHYHVTRGRCYPPRPMALPPLLEVVPLAAPVRAEVVVPGSKSLTNRALVLAALGRGATTLRGALWSDDTQVMVEALRQLGFAVQVDARPGRAGQPHHPGGGAGRRRSRAAGTPEAPLELFVGNAGTATRFLTALLCLGRRQLPAVGRAAHARAPAAGAARGAARPRLPDRRAERPAAAGGARHRTRARAAPRSAPSRARSSPRRCCWRRAVGGWQVERARAEPGRAAVRRDDPRRWCAAFPAGGGAFDIEPDASSGSYFWGGGLAAGARGRDRRQRGRRCGAGRRSGWQIDAEFPRHLPLPAELSRERDLGDSIMTAIVLAPVRRPPRPASPISGRLRVQECERVVRPAHRAGQVRGARRGGGRHPDRPPRAAARRGDRHLRRPPHGHVLRHAGPGGAGHAQCAIPAAWRRRSPTSSPSWRRRRRPGWGRRSRG